MIKDLFANHKGKMFLTLLLSAIFFAVLFPFSDLADLITLKVSDATAGQVYLQFDKMALNFVPVGLDIQTVSVETSAAPALKVDELSASPWLLGLLTAKLGGTVHAKNLFHGDVDLNFKQTGKTADGVTQSVDLAVTGLSLPAVSEYLHNGNILNISLMGNLDLNTSLNLDSSFKEQPSGTIQASGKNFSLPGQAFQTAIGPLQTPQLKLGNMALKAKLGSGKLDIDELAFSGKNQDLTGKMKGQLGVMMMPDGRGGVQPIVKDYDLRIDMTASKSFMDPTTNPASGLLGGFLGQFKTDTPQGTRFAFRMKSPKIPGMPPELSAYQ